MNDKAQASPAPGTPTPPGTTPTLSLAFRARDFLTVAIFVVIYSVVMFAFGMVGVISPFAMVVGIPLMPLVSAIPYMLFLSRVRHAGMVTLFGFAFGLLNIVLGHPWHSLVVCVVCSLIAEIPLYYGRYRSTWAAITAYTVVSAWTIGPWLPFFFDPQGYIGYITQAMGPDYGAQSASILTGWVILGMWVAGIVCGFLGALIGTATLRKHFVRAGLA